MSGSQLESTQALVPVEDLSTGGSLNSNNQQTIAFLTIEKIGGNVETYNFKINTIVNFGRNSNCDVKIDHVAVSNLHFRLFTTQFDKSWQPIIYCTDISRNGTFVNGIKIGKNKTVPLSNYDIIEIRHAARIRFFQNSFSYNIYSNNLNTNISKPPLSSISHYKILPRIIGTGTFGKVYIAHCEKTKNYLACKIIPQNPSTTCIQQNVEANILSKLDHPNIINIHDTFLINNYLFIFEDLIFGGDLFSYQSHADTLRPLPESESVIIVYQILKALEYLHDRNIAHRDLKQDNILLQYPIPGSRVFLADFGVAKSLGQSNRTTTVVGTPEYCAPEVGLGHMKNITPPCLLDSKSLLKKKNLGYDLACDMWSLGVIVHILLSGISPFYDPGDTESILKKVKQGRIFLDGPDWQNISRHAKDFISSLICIDPHKRLTVKECFHHPWIKFHSPTLKLAYEKEILRNWQPSKAKLAFNRIKDSNSIKYHNQFARNLSTYFPLS